jgi:SAM-dependent methyltransferase
LQKRIDPTGYDTDKSQLTHYTRNYEAWFSHLVGNDVKLLELGVNKGGSLLLWRDYFEQGTIIGLDVNPIRIDDPTDRVRFYQGHQQDIALLDHIAEREAPQGFDIIIDDCSHIGEPTRISFWHLFKHHLKPGGIYAIEDWGTGYWDSWIDGKRYEPSRVKSIRSLRSFALTLLGLLPFCEKVYPMQRYSVSARYYKKRIQSHDYGMVGFIKELVDECGMADITHSRWGVAPHRQSRIDRMLISHGHVMIMKSAQGGTPGV